MRRAFAAAYTLPKRGKESCHRAVLLPSKLKVNSASGMAWQPCAAAHATQTSLAAQTTLKAHPLERRRRCVPCRGCVWKCPWHIVRTGFAFARQATRTRTTSTWLRLMPLADLDVRHTSGLGADSAYCGVAVSLSLWIPTPVAALLSHEFNELLGNLLCFQHTYTIYFSVSHRVCLCVCVFVHFGRRFYQELGGILAQPDGFLYIYMDIHICICVYIISGLVRGQCLLLLLLIHMADAYLAADVRSISVCKAFFPVAA